MGPDPRLSRAPVGATRSQLDCYLETLGALARDGAHPADLLAALTAVLAEELGADVSLRVPVSDSISPSRLVPPAALRDPWLLGVAHESLLDAGTRRRSGAHYTPPHVARSLVAFAEHGHHVGIPSVCDPAVGGGVFLLAAGELLRARGVDPAFVVRELCWGADTDALAVAVTRATLALWAKEQPPALDDHIVVADALADHAWAGRFDLVVGNPPFQNQLETSTTRSREDALRLRARFGAAAAGYVDTAALFLLRAVELANPRGRVALVQPHSTLVARSAEATRRLLLERSRLAGLWFARDTVFRAGVRVWAPVLDTAGPHDDRDVVARRADRTFRVAAPVVRSRVELANTWAPLVADLSGVPPVRLDASLRVRDLARATAGFRQQFYGLVDAVEEGDGVACAAERPPWLITSGLIDVLRVKWGSVPARFAGTRYERPVVRLDRVDPPLGHWVRAQLAPKLLVATQTRVLEVAVDEDGRCVPSTPVIAVHAAPEHLWPLAAALSAPPVAAWALGATVGAALSGDAVKLSARQVLEVPLPTDHGAWHHATVLARAVAGEPGEAPRRGLLAEFGAVACAAYGVAPSELLDWWMRRIP